MGFAKANTQRARGKTQNVTETTFKLVDVMHVCKDNT